MARDRIFNKSIFEIISNPSTGVIPVCPKSVGRTVANHMGDPVRVAEKFVERDYAGRAIEPRNVYEVVVKPMLYVNAEGSNNRDIRRLSQLNHRGQRTWHVYKGRIAEDGSTENLPAKLTGI